MRLIGTVFATYVMSVAGEAAIVKMEDHVVPGRQNTRVYREYLAFRLASSIGLAVPPTSLLNDRRYGRISVQRYIEGATKPTPSSIAQMAVRSLGMRIALFDLLCGNHDRKPDNLLQLSVRIIPVDFNTAFGATTPASDFEQETDIVLCRWFGIRGLLSLRSRHLALLLAEVRRIVDQLDDPYIDACLDEIPTCFCAESEALQVRNYLVTRRKRLKSSVSIWWERNIAPLQRFGSDALTKAAREHIR